jgi:SAM-dependent methyltransferase
MKRKNDVDSGIGGPADELRSRSGIESRAVLRAGAGAIGFLHGRLVANRRIDVLTRWFAEMLPPCASVLDVGCGDGAISAVLQTKRPDVRIRGIDVLPRAQTYIPVELFDGVRFPFENASFDVVLFSDVLHHTEDAVDLLREAKRVAARNVLIKDHYRKGLAAGLRLRFMDWVGNARYGVALPYNYWTEAQWEAAWRKLDLVPVQVVGRLALYRIPADWVFGARLHFIALLKPGSSIPA